jgi:Protein of unknown function (DUF3147)
MSAPSQEPSITDRLDERPSLSAQLIREARPRDLAYRFIAGALTSVVSGAVTLAFGARVGGVLLAFPAILAASLTLIEEQEDSVEAREDARGAVMGAAAMVVFAAVAALAFGELAGALALLVATVGWLVTAFGGYTLAWWR